MKKILILAGALLATMASYAQNIQQGGEGSSLYLEKNGEKIVKEKFEKVAVYNSKANLIPAKLKGKWGFYDNDGKLVIPHQYEGMFFDYPYAWYSGGLIQVNFNGKKIFIDKTGNEVQSTIEYFSNLGVDGENRYFTAKDKNGSALANEEKVLTAHEYLIIQQGSKNPITFNAVRKSDNKVMKLDANGQEAGEAQSTPSSSSSSSSKTDNKKGDSKEKNEKSAKAMKTYTCRYCGKSVQSNTGAPGLSGCSVKNPGGTHNHGWSQK